MRHALMQIIIIMISFRSRFLKEPLVGYSNGYPSSERPIYQHSWLDLEDTDEEEHDDAESDLEAHQSSKKTHVEW
ncbi:uncharacterized protein N7506_006793 [Penicillium brevicompactum]|uniref:uncharacterized protein n=1 Tax=Penicillium brevicompactum TaxID=5074 RepID=UPI0025417033|nr:uncharacterized protein N7506_006793 [Penicillium brevicompactum]KAJ5333010.1 hypothetical protein N7506_006793 [Penicillium brevicompactum]